MSLLVIVVNLLVCFALFATDEKGIKPESPSKFNSLLKSEINVWHLASICVGSLVVGLLVGYLYNRYKSDKDNVVAKVEWA
jgi:F0F1-type ATP synthase assembly protein I